MDVKLINNDNRAAWNAYLLSRNNSSFYQLHEWGLINEKHFGHKVFNLAVFEDGEINGVFPAVLLNSRLFGKILCSMPFVNYGGICSDSDAITNALMEKAINIAMDNNCDYLEIRSAKKLEYDLPFTEHKVSMTVDLSEDPTILWNKFTSKHRTNIRRAYKNELHVKSGGIELLETFYKIIAISWKIHGTPFYKKSYFEEIIDKFRDKIRIFICYKSDKPIAAAFNGYYKNTVEGMWAGALPIARKLQYSYVLYWEMIKHACEAGYHHFHLGRSSIESGGENFKKKWNAYQTQLYWYYFLNNAKNLPELNVENPKYRLAMNLWKNMPTFATDFIGPFISKYIP